jgi:hypothetical protein
MGEFALYLFGVAILAQASDAYIGAVVFSTAGGFAAATASFYRDKRHKELLAALRDLTNR